MSSFVLTELAEADIFAIWSHIAKHNEIAADRVERAIYDACEFVAQSPLRRRARPDLTSRSVFFWTLTRYPNYLVIYRPDTRPVQIVAVLHGNRYLPRILKERPVG